MTQPTRSLLQGGKYTPSTHTDIRVLFKRVRNELGIPHPKPAKKQ